MVTSAAMFSWPSLTAVHRRWTALPQPLFGGLPGREAVPRLPASVRCPLTDVKAGGGLLMSEVQAVTVDLACAEGMAARAGMAVAAGRAKDHPRTELDLGFHHRPRALHAAPH